MPYGIKHSNIKKKYRPYRICKKKIPLTGDTESLDRCGSGVVGGVIVLVVVMVVMLNIVMMVALAPSSPAFKFMDCES